VWTWRTGRRHHAASPALLAYNFPPWRRALATHRSGLQNNDCDMIVEVLVITVQYWPITIFKNVRNSLLKGLCFRHICKNMPAINS
jgi:hypothetical protein